MPAPLLVEHAVELAVAPDEVRRTLLELGATDAGDDAFVLPIDHDPAADGQLTATLVANDDGTPRVDIAAGNGIRLPFFHAIVTNVVSIQYEQAINRLVRHLEAPSE